MEAYRMRAQTCLHHADVSSPKKQMVIERLRRRIESYTAHQRKLMSHTLVVDPIAMDQNLAETRLLHQKYLEAKAKKAGKKASAQSGDAKKGEKADDAVKEDECVEKVEPVKAERRDDAVCKMEQPSPEPSASLSAPPSSQNLMCDNVKEEPMSNPGSIAEDIGSLVGDQVDDAETDLNDLVLDLPTLAQDWDLGELGKELNDFDRLVTELKTERDRLDSPGAMSSPSSSSMGAGVPSTSCASSSGMSQPHVMVPTPPAASRMSPAMPQQPQQPPQPQMFRENPAAAAGPAARTLKQMAEQHQMSQQQQPQQPPVLAQSQKRTADGQAVNNVNKKPFVQLPQMGAPNDVQMNQRFYHPAAQQMANQAQMPMQQQMVAQQHMPTMQQRPPQPQPHLQQQQQPHMMHNMMYQQQHQLPQQQQPLQLHQQQQQPVAPIQQQQLQPQHQQNYMNQMAYYQRQAAYRPRAPQPPNYGQMYQQQPSGSGMMMPQNCEVSARVPYNSGSYGVIRLSAQPMMNQNPHFMKCQSWTPPQVTTSVSGMSTQQAQQQQQSLQQMPVADVQDVPGSNFRANNCVNPQMMAMQQQQHHQQHHQNQHQPHNFRPTNMPGTSAGSQQLDTGVPKDLDFFDANFPFSTEAQDLFNSLDSIVSNGCPPGGN